MGLEKTLIGNLSYKLTEEDKTEIAEKSAELLETETWTFTLQDGSEVTKEVCIK